MTDLHQARAHKDKGTALLVKGKTEAALQEFQAAVALCADDLSARRKVAETLVKLGRKEQAIAEYQLLAGRYAADGQLAQAIALGKLILQLDPAHTQTQQTLARLYSRKSEGTGRWVEKIPPSMAGALNLRHVQPPAAPAAAEAAPAPSAAAPAAPAAVPPPPPPGEVEIDVSSLPRSPLFSDLPGEIFLALFDEVALRSVPAGQPLVREGEVGRSMFVVAQGSVRVVRALGTPSEKEVDRMGEGAFFGEIGLLADVPRLASVVAGDECVVLEIERERLAALAGRHPGLEPVLQRFYRERLLANLLRSSPLFSGFDEAARRALIERFTVRRARPGEVLISQGARGQSFFVLLRGACEVFHLEAGREHAYPPMAEGAYFGEIALVRDYDATATVRATADCLLLTLDRDAFRTLLMANPQARQQLEALTAQRLERTNDLLEALWMSNPAWV